MQWNPNRKIVSIPYQQIVAWPDRGAGIHPSPFPGSRSFERHQIAFSMARNIAKSTVRPAITRTLTRNASNMMKALVDRTAADLVTLPDVDQLGDQALNAFAHDVAVGIAGLCMEDLGYVWRAHAKEVLPKARRPDYLWFHPLGATGIVVSEVKGMAGSTQSFSTLKARVHEAFDEQVDHWKLAYTPSGTPIVGGYAIGVRVSHSQPAQVAAVRSHPSPLLPGAATGRPPTVPDPGVVRNHFASALALMGLGGMSRQVAGLVPLPSPGMFLELLQVDDMRFVVRRDGSGGMAIGMAEEAFEYAMGLSDRRQAEGFARDEVGMPPTYRPRVGEGGERIGFGARLLVLAPDGLGLIEGGRRAERSPYGFWTPRGVDPLG
ncbi:hypothetical protein [Sphingomonas aerolata]|uniref:hypothetical protein n=1 Tax=Sphingomonas aerolata TaxID=185951 RepID=UPI00208EBC7A|nr:hypothetical protein [Sphingomonas aerolata]USR00336.1 hypothetical protein NEF64_00230 [Sphingomonas aerolata]